MKVKNIGYIFMSSLLTVALSACNDFLDKEPESAITPASYFSAEADLSAYSINLYSFTSVSPGSYGLSVFGYDNATDNQAAVDASSRWEPGQWKVPSSSGSEWNFSQIRHCNYFLSKVLPKYAAKEIQGSDANIRHYIGEIYVIRAYAYFDKLQAIGDCPIVTSALPDDAAVLVEASKRSPRNKVARFIINNLDTALTYLSDKSPAGKNRISKNVAYQLRSRVALYEGTWEKYHKGTAFVPGGPGWPGTDAEGYNADTEINYFLTEAMASAKVVGDQVVDNLTNNTDTDEGYDSSQKSINPYYSMFCDEDMENYNEILMWRQYSRAQGVTHNIQMQLENNGGGSGWTRGLVNSFLMRNGLPIYAAGSGYNADWEKEGVTATLQNRDSRIKIFTKGDKSVDYYLSGGTPVMYRLNWLVTGNSETRPVTGFPLKKGKAYDPDMAVTHGYATSGSIVFRGTESLLNYMEASYEKNGNIDATASKYWKALRRRAKVDEDFTKTIAATDMTKEAEGDFGAYSHGKLIDATLYNIRRERRDEFIGEGMRWADLKRWRACDQINGYQIEGIHFWGSVYEKDATITPYVVVDETGTTGTVSPQSKGVYLRPYQIIKVNNLAYDGYKFTAAHYLSPLAQSVFRQTASGDQTDLSTSTVYQNPGWPKVAGESPTDVK